MIDTPRNDPAMNEILSSIRRIVADEQRRNAAIPRSGEEILELTAEMRCDGGPFEHELRPKARPAMFAPTSEFERRDRRSPGEDHDDALAMLEGRPDETPDEAAIADIARAVLREELAGETGQRLTRQIRQLVHAEVTRALAERDPGQH
ncbi:MAG: hypothetical protein ACK4WC_09540 [Rubrimonas sp.]